MPPELDLKSNNFVAGHDLNFNHINIRTNNLPHENQDANKRMHTITEWVSSLNFHEVHKDIFEKVAPGTATWILSNPTFLKWLNRSGEALLGIGIPGAGKTCLVSVVVEHLKSLNKSPDGSAAIMYVYCRHKDQLSTAQVLAALLRQLIEQSSEVLSFIEKGLYATCMKDRTKPRQSDLLKALQGAVALVSKALIMVDALDELDEDVRHDVVASLLSLHQSLFMTSRPIPLLDFSGLRLKLEAPSTDFQKLIANKISHVPRLSWLLKHPSRQDVYERIEKKSQGMLLLAALQISSLSSRGITSIKTLETALQAMPTTLDQIYKEILERIASSTQEEQSLAQRSLLWVTHAARFLHVDELLEILAIDLKGAKFDRDLCTREEILLSVCFGLLHVERETRTVHLIHYTAQEYLQSHKIGSAISPHTFLANICALYLSTRGLDFGSLKTSDHLNTVQTEHRFFEYAVCHLGHHTTRACTTCNDKLPTHVEQLFQDQSCLVFVYTIFYHQYIEHVKLIQFAAYYGLEHIFDNCIQECLTSIDAQNSTVFYACLGGQISIVKKLLSLGQINLKYQTNHGATFLHAIGEKGYAEIARLLIWQKDASGNTIFSDIDINALIKGDLEDGAAALLMAADRGFYDLVEVLLAAPTINSSIKGRNGVTPLYMACYNGHESVVKLLLGTPNIDLNAKQKTSGATPVHSACRNGHELVVKLLLGTPGIDLNAKRTSGASPLHSACQNGHDCVVKLLLATPGVDLNAKENSGTTPFYIACSKGHEAVVKLLLATPGIDLNATKPNGASPLHSACRKGHESVVKLLLGTPGIVLNAKETSGAIPFYIACENGHASVVKLLLSTPSIDLNAKQFSGATPFYIACYNGHQSVVKLLLGIPGIHLNAKITSGATPFLIACCNGHESVVKLLLGTPGIDLNAKITSGATPLYVACCNGHESVAKLLLGTPGIDLNARKTSGATAFSIACKNGHEAVVKLLLGTPGIDLNVKETSGATPFFIACKHGHEAVVKLLLGTPGIDLNAGETSGATPFYIACCNGHEFAVKLLLSTPGIDLYAGETSGITPFFIACYNGHESVVKLFLGTLGIDPNVRETSIGATPFYIACDNGHESVVKLLLGTPGIDLNAKITSGATPFFIACCNGHESVVKLLLGTPGIGLNAKITSGATPFHIACQKGHESVVKLLLATPGIDLNAKKNNGATPLYTACRKGHKSVVERLLCISDIDVNITDTNGWTPLYNASSYGHLPIVRLLLHSPNIDATTRTTKSYTDSPRGDTAKQAAKRRGHHKIVELFNSLGLNG